MKTDLRPGFSRRAVGEPPHSPAPPVSLRYIGQEPRLVARVGQVATGDEKQISAELGAHLLRHMPEEWEVIPTSAPQPAASATAPARTGSAAPACKSAPPSRAAKAA